MSDSASMMIGEPRRHVAIEHVVHERDFKQLCDALLVHEIGPLVQTFGASGADKGIDAEYVGEYGGVSGRWVFQYKFLSPFESPSLHRRRLKAKYCGAPSEFDRAGVAGAAGYILITNAPTSVGLVHALRERWAAIETSISRPFVVWDRSRLNAMLKGREYLARSWSGLIRTRRQTSRCGTIATTSPTKQAPQVT